jgi:hypothetical protein
VDQFEDCDTDVATDEVGEADWVSAAPNALTECQRVRCERPRECKGGTADAYKESRLRRASGPPSSSEGRKPEQLDQTKDTRRIPDRHGSARSHVEQNLNS